MHSEWQIAAYAFQTEHYEMPYWRGSAACSTATRYTDQCLSILESPQDTRKSNCPATLRLT